MRILASDMALDWAGSLTDKTGSAENRMAPWNSTSSNRKPGASRACESRKPVNVIVPILTTLTQKIGQENPTFAVAILPSGAGGEIRVRDQVTLLD